MKKLNLQQGFEVIFSISLVVIFIFPVTIWAQSQMNMDINIQNGDTTVNGKKLHELSPNERLAALNYINRLNKLKSAHNTNNSVATEQKSESNAPATVATVKDSTAVRDSADHALHVVRRIEGDASAGSTALAAPAGNGQPDLNSMPWLHRFAHRNTQSFSYTYTGSDSITTQINFHVADEATDTLAKKAMLQISDLRLVPEFSTGKTLLMFSLPTKDAADVSLINSEGKSLLSEKTTAQDFSTTVLLPFNGIYFLHVTQGGKSVTKQIIKN